MSVLNPAAWNGIGIVTFLIVFVTALVMALFRGWIVLGFNHREIMAEKDRRFAAAEQRSLEDAKSIAKFADAAARTTAVGELQQALTDAIRQVAAERTT